MTRHSKNSTAGAFFTSAEKSKLTNYGTQRERLGKDSLRPPTACSICLRTATDPVCCPRGHLFCRECILSSILAQRQRIKREQLQGEEEQRKRKLEEELEAEEEQRRRIEAFEAINRGTKLVSSGKVEDKRTKLAASTFWIPSKTPTAKVESTPTTATASSSVYCPATNNDHPISVKQLFAIKWKTVQGEQCVCSICSKSLVQAKALTLIKPCGHVFCKRCIDELGTAISCFECGQTVTRNNNPKDKANKSDDLLDLVGEGSGFANTRTSVNLQVKKYDPAFI